MTPKPRPCASVSIPDSWSGYSEVLRLNFGSAVPLRTFVNRQLVLTNQSPIQTTFSLRFEYFESPLNVLRQKHTV